jgi:hypothetical protein
MRIDLQRLRVEFRQHGVLSAADLARAAGVSQPTVSRALKQFGEALLRFGSRRGARYALSNPIGLLGTNWPLFVIGMDGQPEQVGRLHALLNGGYWLERAGSRWTSFTTPEFPGDIFPDVPWFLDDYRPQGFLGRAFARRHAAALGQTENPANWGGRAVVEAMLRFGRDFAGAFALGRDSLASALASQPAALTVADRAVRYPELAAGALQGELIGSSAGGEQPKFVVELIGNEIRNLIVKFSAPMTEAIGRRWADLLYAEHVAGSIAAANGFAVARSDVVDFGGLRFLEIERFDRTAGGGRQPVISLRAMATALLDGIGLPWTAHARTMQEQGWLVAGDADRLASAWRFGRLIANTDMHEGNASLIFTPERPVRLAPIYDMLPMAYRPGSLGQIPGVQETQLALCSQAPAGLERDMALAFWEQLSRSDQVSAEFAAIAEQHARALAG